MIDLRSDTVTVPTPGMLKAMMEAEVGDDVFGEDPTANRLQGMAAGLLGKEAALFVASGTMANQVCLKAWTRPGDEVITDSGSHICNYEAGAPAAISGVTLRLLDADRGILSPEQIEPAIRPDNDHFPASRLVAIENTHNRGGGSVYPVETVRGIGEVCRRHNLVLHLDGARLLNACAAEGVDPADYTRHVDSVTLCFSKGLGCPVGSVVAGSREFVRSARRVRKMFGGGMRQIGYIAAAAIYALENNVDRLREDHDNARALADGIAQIESLHLKFEPVTNMVYFDVLPPLTPDGLLSRLDEAGVRMLCLWGTTFRAVCHIHITRPDIDATLRALRETCAKR
ncbi:MAG: GntG family PLP-dependent aldolase [Candidatus Brocadiia bacterium]|nr:GntG family PLP-dependent aldolase [Candidatus Brocadiia bacterium]